jgi:two-component system response regulator PilR (NtrC family)
MSRGLVLAGVAPVEERKRALVVDDDDQIRALLANVVARQDLSVDTARDGVEAIERIDDDNYSVIVLDLMMPRVDGYGVLRHLEEHHPEKLRRTIIASAVPESEVRKKFTTPVYRIHSKPFDMGRLISDIRACAAA